MYNRTSALTSYSTAIDGWPRCKMPAVAKFVATAQHEGSMTSPGGETSGTLNVLPQSSTTPAQFLTRSCVSLGESRSQILCVSAPLRETFTSVNGNTAVSMAVPVPKHEFRFGRWCVAAVFRSRAEAPSRGGSTNPLRLRASARGLYSTVHARACEKTPVSPCQQLCPCCRPHSHRVLMRNRLPCEWWQWLQATIVAQQREAPEQHYND